MTPNQLMTKMLGRGAIPLLLKLARSKHSDIATKALDGLGQVSRTKDCRSCNAPRSEQLVIDSTFAGFHRRSPSVELPVPGVALVVGS